jgi:hypothetical protein
MKRKFSKSMSPETLKKLALSVPLNSVPWFDLLDQLKLFERWLASDSKEQLRYVYRLFCAPNIAKERSARVAELASPALAAGGEGRQQMLRLFEFGEIYHSRELFNLFLELFKEGAFDSRTSRRSMYMDDFGAKEPAMAAELIAHCLDRLVDLQHSGQKRSPLDVDIDFDWLQLPQSIFEQAARLDPATFVQHVLPRVVKLITEHAETTEEGRVLDRVWPYRSLGFHQDFRGSVFEALRDAMEILAATGPVLLEDHTRDLESLPHENIVFLLLTAWTANGPRFGDRIISYLLATRHRLDVGYSSWGTGNGNAAISRAAIKAGSMHCNEANFQRIEQAILDFYPPLEKREPRRLGYTQYLLLNSLADQRRSSIARRRLQELARKFPGIDLEMPSAGRLGGVVSSPIPEKAAQRMSDDQWLSAMLAYPRSAPSRVKRADLLQGGSLELSRQLETETKSDKSRFASLALRMDANVNLAYFNAILRGLVASDDGQDNQSTQKTEIPPVETSIATKVIRHVYNLFGAEAGIWISHAMAHLAERDLPAEILDILGILARNAPDPEQELWQPLNSGGRVFYGGDPLSHGTNTARGGAAHAIASLLFADHDRFDQLRPAVLSLVSDSSLAVRACAIECLLAMLNFNRELAVELFLRSVHDADPILATMFVERFLYYAVFSHYGALRTVLLNMLQSSDEGVRETAAQQIALASFGSDEAEADLASVLTADEVCRAAVARVDAENLRVKECAISSRARLMRFFSDETPKVRQQASRCFTQITDEQLCQELELIDAFIRSPAFESNVNMLLMELENSVARLPDVVCRIPERAVELHRSTSNNEARWWTSKIATLVLRLYEQTTDIGIKNRCLDVIDSMIELDFGAVGFELARLEN